MSAPGGPGPTAPRPVRPGFGQRLRRVARLHASAVGGGAVVSALVLFCTIGPLVAGAFGLDGTTMDLTLGATSPSWRHWLGTDLQGRDLMVRVMEGLRVALVVAAVTTAIAVSIGVTWGAVAAYAGGALDFAMMRIVDALYGLPTLALAIVVMAVVRSRSLALLVVVLAAVSWLTMARIVRAHVRGLRQQPFVEAARALGAGPLRIVLRHLVPNTRSLVIVYATLAMPAVVLSESFLSFLGLGVQAPRASLGTLVTEGSAQLLVFPWLLVGPGLVMAALVLGLSFLGDGLRDAISAQGRR